MNIRIICIGKLKEQYLRDACAEYEKRLSRFCSLKVAELPEYKLPDAPCEAQIKKAVAEESSSILQAIKKGEYVILADLKGKQLTSVELSEHMNKKLTDGISDMAFIIGGSNGVEDTLRSRANLLLSFSKMTFPHQLFRVMLLEQIYRAYKISSGEKYHK